MKLKIALIVILTLVFGYTFNLETSAVRAQGTPITSPITGPVTGPITFAGFKLQGKVTYRIIKRWFHSFGQIIPAENVTVTAKNRETGEKTETQTDANGDYTFVLPSDKYRVSVKNNGTWFFPPFRNVNLKRDTDHVNFQGVKVNFNQHKDDKHDNENEHEDNDD